MAIPFYSNRPRVYTNKLVSVGEAQNKIAAFNALYETGINSSVNACADPNKHAQFRDFVRNGVIMDMGEPMEMDWFITMMGGVKKQADGTAVYSKTMVDVDYNIVAQTAITGGAPGAATVFMMHRSMYDASGKYSNVAIGGSIYIYEDAQWVQVTDIDRTVDFAHNVTVVPRAATYTVNIRGGVKMMFSPVRIVGGESCPVYSNTWETDGYISVVKPFLSRVDRKFPKELDRPLEKVLQFAIAYDENGNEVDKWEYKELSSMRKELKIRNNLDAFIGQQITNPLLTGALVGAGSTLKYTGYDGYLPSVEFGGGTIQEFDPSIGYDLDSDFEALAVRQDAIKNTTEFFGYAGRQFLSGMNRRMHQTVKDSSGACTFQTFSRMGDMNAQTLQKYHVMSYMHNGFSFHFKQMSALTDSRFLGNGRYPSMAFLMPGNNIKDDNGEVVPPIEIWAPSGSVNGFAYQEFVRDGEKINGCDQIELEVRDSNMMQVNAVSRHIILRPQANYAA